MNEQQKYDVIKSLVDHSGNKKAAALKLGCTERSINRMIIKYNEYGKEAFVHGNRGRKPKHTISPELASDIVTIYNNKYYDATFSYASLFVPIIRVQELMKLSNVCQHR